MSVLTAAVAALAFVHGPVNPEDLVQIPGTRWIIASHFLIDRGVSAAGDLYLIDRHARSWTTLRSSVDANGAPEREFAACPGPLAALGSHGLALREGQNGVHRLYVVNHLERESIEVFDVDARADVPLLRWVGCVVLPSNTLPNGVAPTPDGGFVVTSMFLRDDPQRWQKLAQRRDTGVVYRWRPGGELTQIPNSAASGNNGIAVAPDGSVFVAAWGGKAIIRMRETGSTVARDVVALPFLPDNLRWAPDGSLLIAGQTRDLTKFFDACTPQPCRYGWVVTRLNPVTLKTTQVWRSDGTDFSDATTALQVEDEIWIGSAESQSIAILPLDPGRARTSR